MGEYESLDEDHAEDRELERRFKKTVLEKLNALLEQGNILMATVADLDASLDSLGAALTATATAQAQALTDLEAAIAALPGSPDLSAEVARVSAFTTAIAGLGTAAAAADPVKAVPAAASTASTVVQNNS